jgi:hypothetical protein
MNPMNTNIKVDAFGESQNVHVPTPVPVASLVFKNDHARESPQVQLQQLQHLQQLQQLQQLQKLQQLSTPSNPTPPTSITNNSTGGKEGSRVYTPNSEILNITNSDNVIVSIVDDPFDLNSNSNGQMM